MAANADRNNISFVVRLVGEGIKPRAVPLRKLTSILNAVQKIVDDVEDDSWFTAEKEPDEPLDPKRTLHLVRVLSGSAVYEVEAPRGATVLQTLQEINRALKSPKDADWTDAAMSSIEELSAVARSLKCNIEFRRPSISGKLGRILTTILPNSFNAVKSSAFIKGETSVYAYLERIGGATKMGCGIRLADQRKMVFCSVAGKEIARELGQHLYKNVLLIGDATWLRKNWRLRTMKITGFQPPKTGSLLESLRQAHGAGGRAWDEIENPVEYLEEIRGA
ncbi:MAG: hypothetical protein AB7N71_07265 [Phycisphaerae bacterium]